MQPKTFKKIKMSLQSKVINHTRKWNHKEGDPVDVANGRSVLKTENNTHLGKNFYSI